MTLKLDKQKVPNLKNKEKKWEKVNQASEAQETIVKMCNIGDWKRRRDRKRQLDRKNFFEEIIAKISPKLGERCTPTDPRSPVYPQVEQIQRKSTFQSNC